MDTYGSGTLDEALERLHTTGPERDGGNSNHGPMAVEALARHGRSAGVHPWLDRYRDKLLDQPRAYDRVTGDNWREALGDLRRVTDWTAFFERELSEHPWREVLADWWLTLLPGISGASTHPVIRVGHAVRTLLTAGETAPRRSELAQGLGYWAASHRMLPVLRTVPAPGTADASLDAVVPVAGQSGEFGERLPRITQLPHWPEPGPHDPEAARDRLAELVRAATHRYATRSHGDPIMMVHAATAPNAVLRTLPALPRPLWTAGLEAAWAASAAVTAAYTPALPAAAPDPGSLLAEEIFAHAAEHGDEHAIKLTDTALDVGDGPALSAALQAITQLRPAA